MLTYCLEQTRLCLLRYLGSTLLFSDLAFSLGLVDQSQIETKFPFPADTVISIYHAENKGRHKIFGQQGTKMYHSSYNVTRMRGFAVRSVSIKSHHQGFSCWGSLFGAINNKMDQRKVCRDTECQKNRDIRMCFRSEHRNTGQSPFPGGKGLHITCTKNNSQSGHSAHSSKFKLTLRKINALIFTQEKNRTLEILIKLIHL